MGHSPLKDSIIIFSVYACTRAGTHIHTEKPDGERGCVLVWVSVTARTALLCGHVCGRVPGKAVAGQCEPVLGGMGSWRGQIEHN